MIINLAPWSFTDFHLDLFAFVEQCGVIDDVELALSGC
jgi:hypothetical protein